ncbi:MAG: transglycosylase SLT domain-containing protein [Candidatus Aminicenantes bacterium]|nr:transglycosylase SLT domain-containing protein [Candidatus Aminicenantes bacterium]
MEKVVRCILFCLLGGLIIFVVLSFHNIHPLPTKIERIRIITHRPPLPYRLSEEITLCDERIPLEKGNVLERLVNESLLAIGNTLQVMLWRKRSSRYFPYIEKRLAEEGLPEDLKYLPVIESDLKQHARSSVGATGPWQFMKSTARKMGLRVDGVIDERYDFYRSTDAAIKYLKRLNQSFDSWTLSIAAYNLGMTRIRSEMKRQTINDYYYLELPEETERYVFRAIAAKLILSKPEKFGFILEKDQYYEPISHDIVGLKTKRTIPLETIAQASQTYLKTIKELNPQIRKHYLPPGHYWIRIPEGKTVAFEENFRKSTQAIYVVKKGDNLFKIARRHNISISQLRKLNGIEKVETIYPGQTLMIEQGM